MKRSKTGRGAGPALAGGPLEKGPTPKPGRPSRKAAALALLLLAAVGVAFGVARLRPRTGAGEAPGAAPPGMVWVPGGEFTMGTADEMAWADEQPPHKVRIDGFWMDEHEVTNADFRRFVQATGYVTVAEKAPTAEEILAQSPPGTPAPPPEVLVPGALVFRPIAGPIDLRDVSGWWQWTPGANWKHPEGPGSTIEGKDDHPVVQVAWDDARAYATWAGKRLPTEAEWEFAARGGLERRPFAWGDDPYSDAKPQANIWQGEFPKQNSATDGFERTSPAKSYAPNGFGLYDMSGNVWEWCEDWYQPDLYSYRVALGTSANPKGPAGPATPPSGGFAAPMKVQRGGSFLCNDSYCSRYRPGARHGCTPDTAASHGGFRCAADAPGPRVAVASRDR